MKISLKKQFLTLAIERYVLWLNNQLDETDDYKYTTDMFLIDDQERKLYGTSRVLSCSQGMATDYVVHISAYDGDDGGAADLIATFDEDGLDTGKFDLVSLTQVFDCSIDMIYRNGEYGSFGADEVAK